MAFNSALFIAKMYNCSKNTGKCDMLIRPHGEDIGWGGKRESREEKASSIGLG